ncbi:MAG: nucleotidyl transferase AbiEii/AbiGii toxin family protein [Myxococcota bacterium]|nr:nucleotidyl transferase AbiEii/AbiGii toxin family protein [Myxococcota bacterium]
MRDAALALVSAIDDPSARLNLLREYVQAFVLRSLHESEAFSSMAFVGGTALRFIENLPRFSEDLDFSLVRKQGYAPAQWLKKTKQDLLLAGFDCSIRLNTQKTVNTSWIRIPGLLAQAGLSDKKEHNLSIKLEIDTCPPAGAKIRRTVITRHMTIALMHYGLTSLMAGKVHALITRPYAKGRDWYDLIWYLSRRPPIEPKIDLLQNALDQTQGSGRYEAADWRHHIRDKLSELKIASLSQDVSPFLERPADRHLLTRENLAAVLD